MRTEANGKKTPVLFLIITIQHLIPQSCKRKPFLSVRFQPRIALYATLPISTSRQWFWDIVSPPMPNPESCIRAALLSNLPGGYGFPFSIRHGSISTYSRYFLAKIGFTADFHMLKIGENRSNRENVTQNAILPFLKHSIFCNSHGFHYYF